MSERQAIYQLQGQTRNSGSHERPNKLPEPPEASEPLRLGEPDLSYYRALRSLYDAAQIQVGSYSQALGALTAVIQRRCGLGPEAAIDSEGFIHRPPEPEGDE